MNEPCIAFRIDDIGACTKRYEVYSNYSWKLSFRGKTLQIAGRKLKFPIGNWLFLKYLPPFKAWGPYREMTAREWYAMYELLEQFHAKLTVGVTATWAASENTLAPFPQRFPDEAQALKDGVQQGIIEIANHGLTHCVLQNNSFKPKWFSGNRLYHREFWEWLPPETHKEHIARAQEILSGYFQTDIVTFVPPGNRFTEHTLRYARQYGLKYVSCDTLQKDSGDITIIGNTNVFPFHDREVVLYGIEWLRQSLGKQRHKQHCFVKELEGYCSNETKNTNTLYI